MRISKKSFRLQALLVVCISFLPVLTVGVVNYVVDPLQIYRKQRWVEPRFWSNQRSQNAGKIRNYLAQDGYDSIILGNSVADNFRPSRVAETMGWKRTLKLTVDGGTAAEQSFMLSEVLRRSQIKHVFWCNRNNVVGENAERWHPRRSMPFYLYTDTIFDDSPYIFSLDILNFSANFFKKDKDWNHDLEYLNYWQSSKHILTQLKYNSNVNLSKFRSKKYNKIININYNQEFRYGSLDEDVLHIMKNYPNVEFYYLIAPSSRQSLAAKDGDYLSKYFGVQKYLVQQTGNLPNVKIFGFENEDNIVANLANYRDSHHFHSGVNEVMLNLVSKGANRLDVNNIDRYLSSIAIKICDFEVVSDFDTMIPLALQKERDAFRKNKLKLKDKLKAQS